MGGTTFGRAIAEARKQRGVSQKQLAERVRREEDGASISPQYLNDIEHDRRNPSSDHMIGEFARELGLSPDYLHFLAGQLPVDIRKTPATQELADEAMAAFRRTLGAGRGKG